MHWVFFQLGFYAAYASASSRVLNEGEPRGRRLSPDGLMSSREVPGIVLTAACLMAGWAHAQFGVAWQHFPKITVIGADSDPRQPPIAEGVAFWNQTLEELGSGFRLGPVERISRPIPEKALQALSQSIIGGGRPGAPSPPPPV